MSQEKYIGMDVHQATISVAVMDARGKLDQLQNQRSSKSNSKTSPAPARTSKSAQFQFSAEGALWSCLFPFSPQTIDPCLTRAVISETRLTPTNPPKIGIALR
jgi:hypothetical protein